MFGKGGSSGGADLEAGFGGLESEIASRVAKEVLSSTSSQVSSKVRGFINFDIFQPYFELDAEEFKSRVKHSLIPSKDAVQALTTAPDLYGPLMFAFTLATVLMFGMKISETEISRESSYVGTSLSLSFSYWIFTSLLFYGLGYLVSCPLRLVNIFSIHGYSLFGFCLVLVVSLIPYRTVFYASYVVIGGASALSLAAHYYIALGEHREKSLPFVGVVAGLHMLYLMYLYHAHTAFTYSKIYPTSFGPGSAVAGGTFSTIAPMPGMVAGSIGTPN